MAKEDGRTILEKMVSLTGVFEKMQKPMHLTFTRGPQLYVLDNIEIVTFNTRKGPGLIFIDDLSSVAHNPDLRQVTGLGWLMIEDEVMLTGQANAIFSAPGTPPGQVTHGFVTFTPEPEGVPESILPAGVQV